MIQSHNIVSAFQIRKFLRGLQQKLVSIQLYIFIKGDLSLIEGIISSVAEKTFDMRVTNQQLEYSHISDDMSIGGSFRADFFRHAKRPKLYTFQTKTAALGEQDKQENKVRLVIPYMIKEIQMRKTYRISLHSWKLSPSTLLLDDKKIPITLLDISRDGLRFVTLESVSLAIKQRVALVLNIPQCSRELRIEARVKNEQPNTSSAGSTYGISFVQHKNDSATQEALAAISSFTTQQYHIYLQERSLAMGLSSIVM